MSYFLKLLRNSKRVIGYWAIALVSAAGVVFAAPYDANLASKIDTYLMSKQSPIAGNGGAFFSSGVQQNVDPRLIVAISGDESSFGTKYGSCPASGFNAWSYFFNKTCPNSTYSSYAAGISNVTHGMRLYFNRGLTTIPLIEARYCASGCQNWTSNVTTFYTEQGGDTSNLTFAGEVNVDFENLTGPSLFSALQPPVVQGIATISGGQILSAATILPADSSVVYGTSSSCTGCLPTISISFSQKVSNVSLWLLNGEGSVVSYTVADSSGGVQSISIPANVDSGFQTVFIPANNIMSVTISGDTSDGFDFLIDNVRYTPT